MIFGGMIFQATERFNRHAGDRVKTIQSFEMALSMEDTRKSLSNNSQIDDKSLVLFVCRGINVCVCIDACTYKRRRDSVKGAG